MKIVQINALYGEKSTGTIVKDLDIIIQNNDMESYIVYREATEKPLNGIIVGNKLDWKIHALRTRLDGKQGYCSYFSTRRLIKMLEKIKPDILHFHNIHSNFINFPLIMKFAKKNCIAVVLTLHDCWYFTGKCYHFADIGCDKWKMGCGACPKRQIDIPSLVSDSSALVFTDRKKLFDYNRLFVVGCSKWITNLARISPIFSQAYFNTIYNGIDTNIFQPAVLEKKEVQNFTVTVMANKWFEESNQKARECILNYMNPTDRIMIVGCNLEQMDMYSVDSRVVCIGYIKDKKELSKVYANSNVFLNLTHIDTLPTVNMEALACGIPVVTYDVGGSGELVQDGRTGYIIEKDDIDGILTAIESIRKGYVQKECCRQWAIEHFDRKSNYQKYIELYNQIVMESERNAKYRI